MSNRSVAVRFIKTGAGTKLISSFPNMLSTQRVPALFDAKRLVRTRILKGKSYLGFRDEGSSRDGEAVVDCAEVLSHDGETTPLSAARTGRQPLGGENQPSQSRNK